MRGEATNRRWRFRRGRVVGVFMSWEVGVVGGRVGRVRMENLCGSRRRKRMRGRIVNVQERGRRLDGGMQGVRDGVLFATFTFRAPHDG